MGLGVISQLHLPVGLSWRLNEKARIDAEIGLHAELKAIESAPFEYHRDLLPYIGIGYAKAL